jgi:hypothetical protein
MKILLGIFGFLWLSTGHAQISIDTNFPGANAVIDSIRGDTVFFRPDLRETQGDWFYWNLRAISTQPKKWFFKATGPDDLTSRGAAYSLDGGYTWQWVDEANHDGDQLFSFTFREPDQAVRFSMGQPYTQQNLERFMQSYEGDPRLKIEELATTRKRRTAEKILISNFDKKPAFRMLLVARAHACEMMSNYLLEGMMHAMLSDTPKMQALLDKAEIMVIPFLDKDGVEEGDQGKNRIPRDHNRDYSGESLYAITRALREQLPEWLQDTPWIGIDLHNPWIKNADHERIFLVGNANPEIERAQLKFAEILYREQRGSLKFDTEQNFLKYGESWNSGSNYEQGWPFSKWASSFHDKGLLFTTTLEFPYAVNLGQTVTSDNSREFGEDMMYAIAEFLNDHE